MLCGIYFLLNFINFALISDFYRNFAKYRSRDTLALVGNEETWFGGYNEEERTDHLKHCEMMSSGAICSNLQDNKRNNICGHLREH